VREYNEDVGRYNQTFGHREGFTQGDYRGDQINIYNFSAINELTLVMTHELGHALWLDHVDDEQAVMYYLMGEQSLETIALTESDLAHFDAVCTQNSVNDQIRQWFSGFF
ncbi:MAG: matrixin family metalloprotease, partial [Bacteroidota bacterium]